MGIIDHERRFDGTHENAQRRNAAVFVVRKTFSTRSRGTIPVRSTQYSIHRVFIRYLSVLQEYNNNVIAASAIENYVTLYFDKRRVDERNVLWWPRIGRRTSEDSQWENARVGVKF